MPKIARVTAAPGPGPVLSSPQAFGAGKGTAAIGEAIGAVADVSEAIFEAEEDSRVGAGLSSTADRLTAFGLELEDVEKHPDASTHMDLFEKEAEKILKEESEGLRSVGGQETFRARAQSIVRGNRNKTQEFANARKIAVARGKAIGSFLTFQRLHANAESDHLRDVYRFSAVSELDRLVAKGEMKPEVRERMVNEFHVAAQVEDDRRIAQTGADEIFAQFDSHTERLAAARERFSGSQEQTVLALIKDRNNEEEKEKKLADEKRASDLVDKALNGELSNDALRQEQGISAGLRSQLATIINTVNKGAAPPIDYGYVNELADLEKVDDRVFANTLLDPSKLGTKYAEISARQKKILNRVPKTGRSFDARVTEWIGEFKDRIDETEKRELRRRAEDAFGVWSETSTTPATPADENEILDRVTRQMTKTSPPSFLGVDMLWPDAISSDDVVVLPLPKLSGIPESEVRKIISALLAKNNDVTDANIQRMWDLAQKRKKQ